MKHNNRHSAASQFVLTLAEQGTPWAHVYESGRFSGRLAETLPEVNDDQWRWVGEMTMAQFDNECDKQTHNFFHRQSAPEWSCVYCHDAGWCE